LSAVQVLPVVGVLAAALNAFGLTAVAGPGRAISLALWWRISKPEYATVREEDAVELRDLLSQIDKSGRGHVVVLGPPGIGKSCQVDTVLQGRAGVVDVMVLPDASAASVLKQAYRAILGERALGASEHEVKGCGSASGSLARDRRCFCVPTSPTIKRIERKLLPDFRTRRAHLRSRGIGL
jgi:hypothetical protein